MEYEMKISETSKLWISRICSTILGIVFLLAAFSKTNDPVEFHQQLQKISFLNLWQTGIISLLLPGLELVLGFFLLFRLYLAEVSLIATVLLTAFLIYAILNLGKPASECGCMKLTVPLWFEMTGWKVIVRDVVLVGLAALGIKYHE